MIDNFTSTLNSENKENKNKPFSQLVPKLGFKKNKSKGVPRNKDLGIKQLLEFQQQQQILEKKLEQLDDENQKEEIQNSIKQHIKSQKNRIHSQKLRLQQKILNSSSQNQEPSQFANTVLSSNFNSKKQTLNENIDKNEHNSNSRKAYTGYSKTRKKSLNFDNRNKTLHLKNFESFQSYNQNFQKNIQKQNIFISESVSPKAEFDLKYNISPKNKQSLKVLSNCNNDNPISNNTAVTSANSKNIHKKIQSNQQLIKKQQEVNQNQNQKMQISPKSKFSKLIKEFQANQFSDNHTQNLEKQSPIQKQSQNQLKHQNSICSDGNKLDFEYIMQNINQEDVFSSKQLRQEKQLEEKIEENNQQLKNGAFKKYYSISDNKDSINSNKNNDKKQIKQEVQNQTSPSGFNLNKIIQKENFNPLYNQSLVKSQVIKQQQISQKHNQSQTYKEQPQQYWNYFKQPKYQLNKNQGVYVRTRKSHTIQNSPQIVKNEPVLVKQLQFVTYQKKPDEYQEWYNNQKQLAERYENHLKGMGNQMQGQEQNEEYLFWSKITQLDQYNLQKQIQEQKEKEKILNRQLSDEKLENYINFKNKDQNRNLNFQKNQYKQNQQKDKKNQNEYQKNKIEKIYSTQNPFQLRTLQDVENNFRFIQNKEKFYKNKKNKEEKQADSFEIKINSDQLKNQFGLNSISNSNQNLDIDQQQIQKQNEKQPVLDFLEQVNKTFNIDKNNKVKKQFKNQENIDVNFNNTYQSFNQKQKIDKSVHTSQKSVPRKRATSNWVTYRDSEKSFLQKNINDSIIPIFIDTSNRHIVNQNDWSGNCQTGNEQSPIEIEDDVSVCSDSAQLYFIPTDEDISTSSILDNQIQISGAFSSAYASDIDGIVAGYTAYQINIKSPSEHIIDGKQYDVEVQIMHKVMSDFSATAQRKKAGVSILFNKGSVEQTFFDYIKLSNFPSDQYDLNLFEALKTAEFNSTSEYYTYKGSLTQPDCTEEVNWYIYTDPLSITKIQDHQKDKNEQNQFYCDSNQQQKEKNQNSQQQNDTNITLERQKIYNKISHNEQGNKKEHIINNDQIDQFQDNFQIDTSLCTDFQYQKNYLQHYKNSQQNEKLNQLEIDQKKNGQIEQVFPIQLNKRNQRNSTFQDVLQVVQYKEEFQNDYINQTEVKDKQKNNINTKINKSQSSQLETSKFQQNVQRKENQQQKQNNLNINNAQLEVQKENIIQKQSMIEYYQQNTIANKFTQSQPPRMPKNQNSILFANQINTINQKQDQNQEKNQKQIQEKKYEQKQKQEINTKQQQISYDNLKQQYQLYSVETNIFDEIYDEFVPEDHQQRIYGLKIQSESGNQLACIHIEHNQTLQHNQSHIIIYSHGNSSDLGLMLPQYSLLSSQLKVNIFAYDYSGYGLSGGDANDINSLMDIKSVYNFVIEKMGYQWNQIILYGQSIGSGPTVFLASRREFPVGGIVIHSGFSSGLRITTNNINKTHQKDLFPNIDLIPYVKCPVFIIHGTEDKLVPIQQAKDLYEKCTYKYKPYFAQGANHNNIEYALKFKGNYMMKMRQFLVHIYKLQKKYQQARLLKKVKAIIWSEEFEHFYANLHPLPLKSTFNSSQFTSGFKEFSEQKSKIETNNNTVIKSLQFNLSQELTQNQNHLNTELDQTYKRNSQLSIQNLKDNYKNRKMKINNHKSDYMDQEKLDNDIQENQNKSVLQINQQTRGQLKAQEENQNIKDLLSTAMKQQIINSDKKDSCLQVNQQQNSSNLKSSDTKKEFEDEYNKNSNSIQKLRQKRYSCTKMLSFDIDNNFFNQSQKQLQLQQQQQQIGDKTQEQSDELNTRIQLIIDYQQSLKNQGLELHKIYGYDDEETFLNLLRTPNSVITHDRGSPEDYERSAQLEKWVTNEFITPQQQQHKANVLKKIEKIIEQWSDEVIRAETRVERKLESQYRCKLLTFGSYLLGVASVDGDIDTVIIAPSIFKRAEHFEQLLYEKLLQNPNITQCKLIKSSRSPIITFFYEDQNIDLSLSILNQSIVPSNIQDEIPEQLIKALSDQKDKISIIGRRNNQLCLKVVGNSLPVYLIALKALKIWYKAKYLYPNRLGYLGGIDIAILAAKICQLFPNYPLTKILEEFFRIYSQWNWSIPIKIIEEIQDPDQKQNDNISNAFMTISAPAHDYQNTSKASQNSRQVIVDTFKKTSDQIQQEIKPNKKNWIEIFNKYEFFNDYQMYVQIDFLCFENSIEILDKMEVKLIRLFNDLGKVQGFYLHPFPYPFTKVLEMTQKQCLPGLKIAKSYFIGIKKLPTSTKKELKLESIVSEFLRFMTGHNHFEDEYYNKKIIDVHVYQVTLNEINDIYFPDKIVPPTLKGKVLLESQLKELQKAEKLKQTKLQAIDQASKQSGLIQNGKRKLSIVDTIQSTARKQVKQNINIQDMDAGEEFL
ncbi:Nucleotidyltransferase, class I, C-terminal-like [Pseudocohnilembus persalinus]|uniref:polynucleotide adenylyltransferase n=1 Tax=Pseudocohnilembus persalinus TaxID=266149 RepID=A0A0V0QQW8_PSEPJ|nr:Nucleotidyltransferase, class I, C-terminal-like [Pseudocohnilembus persalinus]|eukprot:KRX04604.1 Nucleotidyltransferase, class I, C-terminal-like [Pseudocohnilembus persalinus]